MNRRRFLLSGAYTIAGLAIPVSMFVVPGTVKKYAVLTVKKELKYLKLSDGSVEKYIEDYFNGKNDLMEKAKWKFIYYSNLNWEDSDQLADLVKYYLLSTDFFINRMNEEKVIKYLGFYSPYKSPVPNPFSYTLYPPNKVENVYG